ncbi:MAG: glycosyltransferase [Gammaproteobacteria bacterium]|nr:MAG: glycosyltransferase [Gammaproteobacteria bacterium]
MSRACDKTELLVLGVHLDSEGYPNVRYRIQGFRQSARLAITEINVPMWRESVRERAGKRRFVPGLFRAVYAHLSVGIKYLLLGRATQVYVPYPSVFVGLILGLLPRAVRPDRIVLDAFISLYDTVVNDRKLLSSGNWLSILLKRMEKAAYSSADLVIVDTPQNAAYLCREFGLPENKVVDVPLSSDEQNYQLQPYLPNDEVCRVLFIGTFVPLHGVSTILTAAQRLEKYRNIQFKIIGDGQTAAVATEMLHDGMSNVVWERDWKTPSELARLISEADICLGIFGTGGKAQRVCPLKFYAYAACGRPIITGDTEWTQHAGKDLSYEPFETVPVCDGAALADRIKQLAGSLEHRRQLAENSRRFYAEQLCNEIALSRLEVLLRGS